MKRQRGWRIVLVVLGLVLVAAVVGVRQFLTWGGATRELSEGLSQQLGAPVSVAGSRVTLLGDTALTGVEMYEPGGKEPFLRAERIVADLNALSYALGRRLPRRVQVEGGEVHLRFDAAGHLLIHLGEQPSTGGPMPAVQLRDCRVIVEQEGRPAFTLAGIDLTLGPGENKEVSGQINDPTWGTVEVAGQIDTRTLAGSLQATSKGLTLSGAKLRTLPLVPPSLWQHVELAGKEVPLRLTVHARQKAPRVRFDLEFDGIHIRLPQPDRPAFLAGPARGKVQGTEEGFVLSANVNDPIYGRWSAAAGFSTKTGAIQASLSTAGFEFTQEKLERLPYVPRPVLAQVRKLHGRASGKLTVGLNTRQHALTYRAELNLLPTRADVVALGLEVDDLSGRVIADNGRVWLEQVRARAAGGKISSHAEGDFRQLPWRLHFRARAKGLVLHQLPKKWKLPKQLDGDLEGQADLSLLVRRDRVEVYGHGEGEVDHAMVVGFPTSEPVKLELEADGASLRFVTPTAQAEAAALVALTAIAPPAGARKESTSDLGEAARGVKSSVGEATHQVARGAASILSGLGSLGRPAKPDEPPSYLNAHIGLNDVDLAVLARRVGVKLPRELNLSGKLSLKVDLGLPINKASDYRAYRIDGSATSAKLSVAGIDFRHLNAQLHYRDGVLSLQRLAGQVGEGSFAGQASAAVFPRGDVSANLELRRLPLDALAALLPGGKGSLSGSLSGQATARAPLNALADANTWRGKLTLHSDSAKVAGLGLRDLRTQVTLVGGKLTLTDLAAQLGEGSVKGTATVSLVGPRALEGRLTVRKLDVSVARPFLPGDWRTLRPAGSLGLTGEVKGTLQPLALTGQGRLEGHKLQVRGVGADSLGMDWTVKGQVLALKDIQAKLYRGSITGSARVSLLEKRPIQADLTMKGVDLAAVAKGMGGLPVPVAGELSGRADVTMRPAAKGGWRGEATVRSPRLVVQNIPATGVKGKLEWHGGRLEYHIDGEALGGTFSVEGQYPPGRAARR